LVKFNSTDKSSPVKNGEAAGIYVNFVDDNDVNKLYGNFLDVFQLQAGEFRKVKRAILVR